MQTSLILGVATISMLTLISAKFDINPAISSSAPTAVSIQISDGEALINKSDCMGCHHKVNKLIGPSYIEIAKKYPNNSKNIDYLAEKIIKGGSGVWGKIPMTPHPKISENDVKLMAKYILSLNKK